MKNMVTPDKICAKCTPILIDFHTKQLNKEEELRRMKNELERVIFSYKLSCLVNHNTSNINNTNNTDKAIFCESPLGYNIEKSNKIPKPNQSYIDTSSTMITNMLKPSLILNNSKSPDTTIKYMKNLEQNSQINSHNNIKLSQKSTANQTIQSIDDFETEINMKIQSFKKKLFDDIHVSRRSSPKLIKINNEKIKSSGSIHNSGNKKPPKLNTSHRYNLDTDQRSRQHLTYSQSTPNPSEKPSKSLNLLKSKASELSPARNSLDNRGRIHGSTDTLPIFSKNNNDKELLKSTKELSLSKIPRRISIGDINNTTNDHIIIPPSMEYSLNIGSLSIQHDNLGLSGQKIKEDFHKELENLKNKSLQMTDDKTIKDHINHSPFFSPLKASDLNNNNGIESHECEHLKSIEVKAYKKFIMPGATPLLNDLLSSKKTNYYKNNSISSNKNKHDEISQFDKYDGLFDYNEQNTFHYKINHPSSKDLLDDVMNEKQYDQLLYPPHLEQHQYSYKGSPSSSVNLNKRFEDEMKNDEANTNDMIIKNSNDQVIMNKTIQNMLIETGEFGLRNNNNSKMENKNPNFDISDQSSLNLTKSMHNQEELEQEQESPDIDNIKVKEDSSIVSTSNNSSKWYKLVCIKDSKYYSMDGQTEYVIGKKIERPIAMKANKVEGGIGVYNSIQAALKVKIPSSSKYGNLPKAILRLNTHRPYLKKNSKSYLYSAVTPIEVLYVG